MLAGIIIETEQYKVKEKVQEGIKVVLINVAGNVEGVLFIT